MASFLRRRRGLLCKIALLIPVIYLVSLLVLNNSNSGNNNNSVNMHLRGNGDGGGGDREVLQHRGGGGGGGKGGGHERILVDGNDQPDFGHETPGDVVRDGGGWKDYNNNIAGGGKGRGEGGNDDSLKFHKESQTGGRGDKSNEELVESEDLPEVEHDTDAPGKCYGFSKCFLCTFIYSCICLCTPNCHGVSKFLVCTCSRVCICICLSTLYYKEFH